MRKRWSALATIAVPSSRRTRQAAFVVVHAACTGVGTSVRLSDVRVGDLVVGSEVRSNGVRSLVPSTMRIRVSRDKQYVHA